MAQGVLSAILYSILLTKPFVKRIDLMSRNDVLLVIVIEQKTHWIVLSLLQCSPQYWFQFPADGHIPVSCIRFWAFLDEILVFHAPGNCPGYMDEAFIQVDILRL